MVWFLFLYLTVERRIKLFTIQLVLNKRTLPLQDLCRRGILPHRHRQSSLRDYYYCYCYCYYYYPEQQFRLQRSRCLAF